MRQNGADSSAAQAARAQLITDLENAGVNAKTATGLVDGLGQAVDSLPAGKNINIDVTGQGTWTITGLAALLGETPGKGGILPTPSGNAQGGKIAGYGGGDTVLALVEPGETILPKEATSDPMTVAVAKKYGVPGFASGGIAGLGSQIIGSYNATQDAMVKSMQQALIDAITKAAAAVSAAAAAGRRVGIHRRPGRETWPTSPGVEDAVDPGGRQPGRGVQRWPGSPSPNPAGQPTVANPSQGRPALRQIDIPARCARLQPGNAGPRRIAWHAVALTSPGATGLPRQPRRTRKRTAGVRRAG